MSTCSSPAILKEDQDFHMYTNTFANTQNKKITFLKLQYNYYN